MLDPKQMTAVVVTRGDVELDEVLASLRPFGQVFVWNNRWGIDKKVYGRYMAAIGSRYPVIYTQDDDCIVEWEKLLPHYHPEHVLCNMPADRRGSYRDGTNLIGWGCIFHRDSTLVLEDYLATYPRDDFFFRTCDRIFTKLNVCRLADVPFRHLHHAHAENRMAGKHNAELHYNDTTTIRERLQKWSRKPSYMVA